MKARTAVPLIAALILAVPIPFGCTSTPVPQERGADRTTKTSPPFRDGRFHDTGGKPAMSLAAFASTTWEYFFGDAEKTPRTRLPVQPADLTHFNRREPGRLSVTWLGHSSLMIHIDGYRLLTDPVFEKRVSVVGPTRFNGDLPLDPRNLPDIDAVIVSHDHYDHLNRFSIQAIHERTRTFLVPTGVGRRLRGWGVPDHKIVELGWWEETTVGRDLTLTATPAQHFSGRGLADRNRTLWASWVVRTPGHRIFFSGDSGYFDGFRAIGEAYGPFDMTFIECGAYNPAWHPVHMYPEETVRAHRDLRGNILHPIHWGTFNLALHAWYEPMVRLAAAARSAGIATATPVVGQTTVYGRSVPAARWWEPLIADRTAQGGKRYALQTGSQNRR